MQNMIYGTMHDAVNANTGSYMSHNAPKWSIMASKQASAVPKTLLNQPKMDAATAAKLDQTNPLPAIPAVWQDLEAGTELSNAIPGKWWQEHLPAWIPDGINNIQEFNRKQQGLPMPKHRGAIAYSDNKYASDEYTSVGCLWQLDKQGSSIAGDDREARIQALLNRVHQDPEQDALSLELELDSGYTPLEEAEKYYSNPYWDIPAWDIDTGPYKRKQDNGKLETYAQALAKYKSAVAARNNASSIKGAGMSIRDEYSDEYKQAGLSIAAGSGGKGIYKSILPDEYKHVGYNYKQAAEDYERIDYKPKHATPLHATAICEGPKRPAVRSTNSYGNDVLKDLDAVLEHTSRVKESNIKQWLGNAASNIGSGLATLDPTAQAALGLGTVGALGGGLYGGLTSSGDDEEEDGGFSIDRGLVGAMLGGGIGAGLGAGGTELTKDMVGAAMPDRAENWAKANTPWLKDIVGKGVHDVSEATWDNMPRDLQYKATDAVTEGYMPHSLMQRGLKGIADWGLAKQGNGLEGGATIGDSDKEKKQPNKALNVMPGITEFGIGSADTGSGGEMDSIVDMMEQEKAGTSDMAYSRLPMKSKRTLYGYSREIDWDKIDNPPKPKTIWQKKQIKGVPGNNNAPGIPPVELKLPELPVEKQGTIESYLANRFGPAAVVNKYPKLKETFSDLLADDDADDEQREQQKHYERVQATLDKLLARR